MIYNGSTKIETPYYGSSKIVCAYYGSTLVYGEPPTPVPQAPTGNFLAFTYNQVTAWWKSSNGTTYTALSNMSINTDANSSYAIAKCANNILYVSNASTDSTTPVLYPYIINITGDTATQLGGITLTSYNSNDVLSLVHNGRATFLFYWYSTLSYADVFMSTNDGTSWTKIHTTTNDIKFPYAAASHGNFIKTKTGTYFYGYSVTNSKGARLYISDDLATITEAIDDGTSSISPAISNGTTNNIFYMNGRYYVSANSNIYATSESDNFAWSVIGSSVGSYICSNYDDTAVCINGTSIYYSYDCINWIAVSSVPTLTGSPGVVAYGNGMFNMMCYVASSSQKSTTNAIYSTDGITWTSGTTPSASNYNVYLGCF